MNRITGLATGIDTDSIIKNMMKVERMKVDTAKQDQQYVKWQQEAYREIANLLRSFQSDYFDLLNPSTNFRSPSMFAAFNSIAQVNGVDTSVVTVKAGSGATVGTHTLKDITLAKNDIWESSVEVSQGMVGDAILDFSGLKEGKSFNITLDGMKKTITLDADYVDMNTLINGGGGTKGLQKLVDEAFGLNPDGSKKINVLDDGGKLKFDSIGHTVEITNSPHTYVTDLGFSNGQTNSITGSAIDFTNPITIVNGKINIDIDGTTTEINVNIANASNIDDFVTQLQTSIDTGIGANKIKVDKVDGENKIKFVSHNTSEEITFTAGTTDNVLNVLGISSGAKINKMEGKLGLNVNDIGKEFNITIGGTDYFVDLTKDYDGTAGKTFADLANDINTQISGSGAIISIDVDGNISFSGTAGNEVKIWNSTESIVDDLGFTSGDKNIVDINKSLNEVFGISGDSTIEINGKTFTFGDATTIGSVINQINNSDAGVTLSYSSLSNKFTLQAKEEGAANKISFSGALLTDTFNLTQNSQIARDAEFTLDGVATTRGTNEFTVDGVTYTLNSDYSGEEIQIGVSANPDELVDKIKGFVEDYNKLISTINEKTSEKRYRDYRPLTEEQKKEMSEKDIELWEEKAKSGILRSDVTLNNITREMRMALYSEVEGVDTKLYSIGITTSSNYENKGKLVIDEEKLRAELEKKPNEVMELFTKSTNSDGSKVEDSKKGLAHKLYDILQNNIRTTRNDQGQKGTLLEKAGIEGDVSEFENILTKKINTYDKTIADLLERLVDKENHYYSMFASMEKAISQMNAQSSWLMSQFGGGMQ